MVALLHLSRRCLEIVGFSIKAINRFFELWYLGRCQLQKITSFARHLPL